MRAPDLKVLAFESLEPWTYDHIVRLAIDVLGQTDRHVGVTVVTIWLRRGREPATKVLKAVFTDVTDLNIRPFSFPSGPITVKSWVGYGWADVNFRVEQDEQDQEAVELYCRDFEFALVDWA